MNDEIHSGQEHLPPAKQAPKPDTTGPKTTPGPSIEAVAQRIYQRVLEELASDDMTPDESELDEILQDAREQAGSCTPETENDLVTQVTDRYTMRLMEMVDGDELYRILNEFTADVKRFTESLAKNNG
jgi:hypothetical protein